MCLWLFFLFTGIAASEASITVKQNNIPSNPLQIQARYINFRPFEGQTVSTNPPRFSWPYKHSIVFTKYFEKADTRFTLQISKTNNFLNPYYERKNLDYNFYNYLPVLKGQSRWFWRVGYQKPKGKIYWSKPRSFFIDRNSIKWDRMKFPQTIDRLSGHPRILFTHDNREDVFKAGSANTYSAKIKKMILTQAEKALSSEWYTHFPENDQKKNSQYYAKIGQQLTTVLFAYHITEHVKFAGCKQHFLTMAAWPPGGLSSPEGHEKTKKDKWGTHITGYLGLFYDWQHHDLTPADRRLVRDSIEWRIDHSMNNFAWLTNNGKAISQKSVGVQGYSHPYENLMVSIPGAIAICDESEIARNFLKLAVSYIIGVTSNLGEEEAWNEGPGYGNGKMKWLMDATWYLQTAMPSLHLQNNPMYSKYCDFFSRITPIGVTNSSFGHRGFLEADWCAARIQNFRKVALLCNDEYAYQNWIDTRKRMSDIGRQNVVSVSPWIDFVLPYYGQIPKPANDPIRNRIYPIEGWVFVNSASPNSYQEQKQAVSMSFACRPRGEQSHAFLMENAFDITAYGETIATGGGTTKNGSLFAEHSMSHNTILINGQGQTRTPMHGRIISYDETEDYVYWAGNATEAYPKDLGLETFIRHVLFIDNAYFIIFDELAIAPEKPQATFQWLYHYTPALPANFDPGSFSFQYTKGNTKVIVQHVANIDQLTFNSYPGKRGMINPITGENLSQKPEDIADANHIWISTLKPDHHFYFMTVIIPYRLGEEKPVITTHSDALVKISFRNKIKTVSFSGQKADIIVKQQKKAP
ncbi:MAG: DUF4962 domain-containing protein [Pseudomonadota bacterium]